MCVLLMGYARIKAILDIMHQMYGDYPLTELNYETPFQCLIAVMMSAQTTDKQVNKVTENLFQTVVGPQDVLAMGQENFAQAIKTIGLRKAKAKNIYTTAQMLVDTIDKKQPGNQTGMPNDTIYKDADHVQQVRGYRLPDTIEKMTALPGVGVKTAKVVLYVLYRQRWVAVDTHVHRVMNRLDVVNTKTPDQTSKQLETLIPDSYKDIAHHTIIYFGRYHCTAKKPQCTSCPLKRRCRWVKENKN